MFFEVHSEKKIGFKKLSPNDLGLKESGHQTHIGLYQHVLDFLPDNHVEKAAILIYDDYCEILNCDYGKINRSTGKMEAPNIKSGARNEHTIVNQIREFASLKPTCEWYLVWFGLQSEELVFWLISSDSEDFQHASNIFPTQNKVYDENSASFSLAIDFLEKKVNGVSIKLQEEIEVASQTGKQIKKYKKQDIEKANKLFKQIGYSGEQIIAHYLEKQKLAHTISNYRWMNANTESGMPFDFIINEGLEEENFIDVKSTRFDFNQYLYYSDEEIGFVHGLKEDKKYSVYRVFDMDNAKKKLRVCTNCMSYVSSVNADIADLSSKMEKVQTILQSIKIGVRPNDCFVNIQPQIIL